jgi:non-specific serine/threonine protein kinase
MKLAEEAEPQLTGTQQAEWLARLEDEHDNIREALRWALALSRKSDGEISDFRLSTLDSYRAKADNETAEVRVAAEIALRMAGALGRFWWMRGYYGEGREHLERALSHELAEDATRAMRGKALAAAGNIAYYQADYTSARSLLEESLVIRRELGDKGGIALSLINLGNMAYMQGDYESARSQYEESLAIRRELGDKWGIALSLNNLGLVTYIQGDYASARSLYEEGLAIRRALGDRWGIALSLHSLGNVAHLEGDVASARSRQEESLAIFRELGTKGGIALSLISLGHIAHQQGDAVLAAQLYAESLNITSETGARYDMAVSLAGLGAVACTVGQPERGARLLGAVEAITQALGLFQDLDPNLDADQAEYAQGVASARAQLGEEAFTAAWTEGRAMSMEQTIAYALEETIEETLI